MKQHPIFVVVALITTLLCGTLLCTCVTADNPDDKIFGNGRFLRRLRDDVAERMKSTPKKMDSAKTPTQADPNSRGATPTSSRRAPTSAARSSKATPSRKRRTSESNKSADRSSAARVQSELKKSNQQARAGFGMQIESKNDELIVTKIESRGNATEAGVRKGDVLVAAGGVDIKSVEELQEITKILGNGDQLEFEFSRRGKKTKTLIQFGDAPKESEVIVSKTNTPARTVSDYNFLPEPVEPTASNLRSVLNDRQSDSRNSFPRKINRIPNPGSQSDSPSQLHFSESNTMIEQQRLKIEQLQHEIEILRQKTEANLNGRGTKWYLPGLSGPRK